MDDWEVSAILRNEWSNLIAEVEIGVAHRRLCHIRLIVASENYQPAFEGVAPLQGIHSIDIRQKPSLAFDNGFDDPDRGRRRILPRACGSC